MRRKLSRSYYKSPTYNVWRSIISRCESQSCGSYERYGAVGIRICDKWRRSFESFYDDMGDKPGENYQIDRIKNELGYEPGNCRWVTRHENARNKSNNHLIEYNGETRCLAEWCEIKGVPPYSVQNRMKLGWSFERAIETPFKKISRVSTGNVRAMPAWEGVFRCLVLLGGRYSRYDAEKVKKTVEILGWRYEEGTTETSIIKALGKNKGKLKKSIERNGRNKMAFYSLPDVLTV